MSNDAGKIPVGLPFQVNLDPQEVNKYLAQKILDSVIGGTDRGSKCFGGVSWLV